MRNRWNRIKRSNIWKVAWGVFFGMWLYNISNAVLYILYYLYIN